MMYIQKEDRVLAISGHFEGKRGYVCRVSGDTACVAFKGVWDHGIWVPKSDLKRTKRYKQTNNEGEES
jgi:ribosomal protein L24